MFHETAAIALAVVMGLAPVEVPAEGPVAVEPVEPVEVAEVSEPEPVAPAPVVTPTPVQPRVPRLAGPMLGPPVVVDVPTPLELRAPEPAWDGKGLLIGAGVMGGINIGLAIARLGLGLGESTAERERARLLLTAVAMPIDVAAGIGLAAAGGHYRGRHDGWRTAYEHRPKLNAKAFTSSGAILLVMGAVAWASAWTPWHGDATLDGRGNGTLMVESLGSLLLMGGSGLLAYGVSWKKHSLLFGRSTRPFAVRPAAGPGFAGLAVSGRF